MFSSGIRWPRLAAHDREEERGSLSASRATGGPLRVRSARSGGGGQNGCCLPSGGVGTACDGLDLPSRFEGCRADGIVHSIQERSRSPRPRTLGDRGKGLDSPCPMDGGILGRRAMEEKDASAVALAWTCSSCRPYSSRSLTGRLPSGWGVAVAVTVTMAVGELGRSGGRKFVVCRGVRCDWVAVEAAPQCWRRDCAIAQGPVALRETMDSAGSGVRAGLADRSPNGSLQGP